MGSEMCIRDSTVAGRTLVDDGTVSFFVSEGIGDFGFHHDIADSAFLYPFPAVGAGSIFHRFPCPCGMGVLSSFFLGYYNSASRTNLLHDSVFRASRIFQCNIVTSRVTESVNRFFFQNSAASITLCNTDPFGCTSRRNSCYRRARSVPGGRNGLCPYQAPASFTVPGFLALSVAGCRLVDDRITALLVSCLLYTSPSPRDS